MKVLLVYKISLLGRLGKSVRRLTPSVRARLARNDRENRRTIEQVAEAIERSGAGLDRVSRTGLKAVRGYGLVVVVGGDGTFFGASHRIASTPVMLVNSDPGSSLGLFACCTRRDFRHAFERFLDGRLAENRLNRLRLSIPARRVDEPVINDILFAHRNPVAMTRYYLRARGRKEYQQSSGVWVSTAAGSTGSVLSAGGRMMPLSSTKMQWVVREPYSRFGRYRLLKGFAERRLDIIPETVECAVWVDGSWTTHAVGPGETITLSSPGEPLVLVGYSDARRRRLFG
jgi:NAD+ kinase